MRRITLIRHAETVANAAGVWQGHGDAGLSGPGLRQAEALGERLRGEGVTHVVSSDLARAMETCRAAGLDARPDAAWREMDIGAWEGMTRDELYARFPAEMKALASDADVPMGGGETWAGFTARVAGALDDLAGRLPDGSDAVVVTHGGVVLAATTLALGIGRGRRGWPIDRVRNTAMTTVVTGRHGLEVHGFNDARHLDPPDVDGDAVLSLVRHGESAANVDGRWHGRSDGPLSARGVEQAAALAHRLPAPGRVYSSPLVRALDTARRLAGRHGLDVEVHDGLAEMDLGEWEGMTAAEISLRYPEEWDAVFEEGIDLPRGRSGETFTDATLRGRAAFDEIAARHPTERVAVVTHGVLIRAVVSDVLGVPWPASRRLGIPGNAAVANLRFREAGPVLVDYDA
jgi:glucosyl-3-phosphoglycerate phosphatase